ncbi:dapper homolog 2 [Lissotriton helveticus]
MQDVEKADKRLRVAEQARPEHLEHQREVLEAKEMLATEVERLCCFDYRKYVEKTHAEGDKAGTLLAWLANPIPRSSPILALRPAGGPRVYTQSEIMHGFREYYERLYGSTLTVDEPAIGPLLGTVRLPQLEEEQARHLGRPISLEEIRGAIKQMARNKTLGVDGLPVEFYMHYVDILAPQLLEVYSEARELGQLPESMREALIVPLLKPGHDSTDIAAYRPLSMLTTDYKILSRILASRLQQHMPTLIHEDQAGFIPTMNTSTNVRRLVRIMGEADMDSPTAAILSVDIEKAFDSLEWPYLYAMMGQFGLADDFVEWTTALYTSAVARVRVGQMISPRSGLLGAGGLDRGRLGERLQAALAGLRELHLLRSRQQALVTRALAMDPVAGAPVQLGGSSEERGLECTLSALREQLSRLRRQDVGLKRHLDQLDQQISELKLDVNKASSEHIDSDSRPSSGFYELSDGGSCSLSASCTSVYSDSVSSSHGSLHPCALQPRTRLSIFDCRPRSADETNVHAAVVSTNLQRHGSHIRDGCRIRTSVEHLSNGTRPRPRPVSTGDVERIVAMQPGFHKTVDLKSVSSLCHGSGIQHHVVDPKYENDLIPRRGSEVYPYPSPLHAVALQSPLFSLIGESWDTDDIAAVSPPAQPSTFKVNGTLRIRPLTETRPGGYIKKLLELHRYKTTGNQANACSSGLDSTQRRVQHQRLPIYPTANMLKRDSCCQLAKQGGSSEGDKAIYNNLRQERVDVEPENQPEFATCTDSEELFSLPSTHINKCFDGRSKISGFVSREPREHFSELSSSSSLQACSEESCQDPSPLPAKIILSRRSNKKNCILKPAKVVQEPQAQTNFVHAQFVPAKSQNLKAIVSSSKAKAVKVKRRNSGKLLSPTKHLPGLERPKGLKAVTKLTAAKWTPARRNHSGKSLVRRPTYIGDVSARSRSESSLLPVHLRRVPHDIPKAEAYRAPVNKIHLLKPTHIDNTTKRKPRKWQSTFEISTKADVTNIQHGFAAGLGPPTQSTRRAGGLYPVSFRARPSLPHPSAYAKSESEFSADCASLFHSTIIETSEDEVSKYTTNRFGDSESSQSESDVASSGSSLTLDSDDINELVWAEAPARLPAIAQPTTKPLPEPKIYRIKASKALKKKIRRFQPASLKVMTMV